MGVPLSMVMMVLQLIVICIGLLGTIYAFHKKFIMPELMKALYTREEGLKLEQILYPKSDGLRLEREFGELKREYRDDIKIIQSDIKKILSHYGD